jgi:hypothetical protein
MASIPVSAEQPAANAFRVAIAPSASVMWIGYAAPTTAAGCARSRPTTMTPKIAARNHHRHYERACALGDAPQVHGSDQDQADQAQREHVVGQRVETPRPGFAAPAVRLTATVSTFGVGRWQCVGSGRLSAPTIGPSPVAHTRHPSGSPDGPAQNRTFDKVPQKTSRTISRSALQSFPRERVLTFGLTGGGARAIARIDPVCHR